MKRFNQLHELEVTLYVMLIITLSCCMIAGALQLLFGSMLYTIPVAMSIALFGTFCFIIADTYRS